MAGNFTIKHKFVYCRETFFLYASILANIIVHIVAIMVDIMQQCWLILLPCLLMHLTKNVLKLKHFWCQLALKLIKLT